MACQVSPDVVDLYTPVASLPIPASCRVKSVGCTSMSVPAGPHLACVKLSPPSLDFQIPVTLPSNQLSIEARTTLALVGLTRILEAPPREKGEDGVVARSTQV